MPQDFDLRINGRSELITKAQLTRTFDTALEGFTAQLTVDPANQPDLFRALNPYRGTPCQIWLENQLQFTGKITKPGATTSPNSSVRDIEGFSLPFNFVDSSLNGKRQQRDLNLHDLAREVAKQTATAIKIQSGLAPGGIFKRATVRKGHTAFQFLAPLAKKRQQVISNTVNGEVLFQVADLDQTPMSTIEEGVSTVQSVFTFSPDLRKRFKTYQASVRSSFGRSKGVATDDNINEPRHKVISENNIPLGSGSAIAEWVKHKALIDELTQTINVLGWKDSNGKLWEPGQLVPIKSISMSIPDGFTFFINRVVYAITGRTKTAQLSIIPKEIHTGQPIIEPWFTQTNNFSGV